MNTLFTEKPTESASKKALRWGEYVLLALGLLCMTGVGLWIAQSSMYQSYQSYELEQRLHGQPATATGYIHRLITGRAETQVVQQPVPPATGEAIQEETAPPPPPIREGEMIGRIEIPRVKVSAIVREGVDTKTLGRAVGHVPETPLPGRPGNVGIAAHRDTFFRGLRNIKKGDLIRMVTPGGTYEYSVDSLKIVMPENVEVLDPTPNPAITLVTCFPFDYIGSAPKRFIVRATQTGTQPANAGS
ncbi:MAG TPA: class D sortase [Bryobacteraceae bacterium]|nr:class D sortase [Bryobacteraceae bacterium]